MFAPDGDRLVVIAGRPGTKTWWRNFGARPQVVIATEGGRRRVCRAWRPDAATDQHRSALAAYRRRFARARVEDGTPLIVLERTDQASPARRALQVTRRTPYGFGHTRWSGGCGRRHVTAPPPSSAAGSSAQRI